MGRRYSVSHAVPMTCDNPAERPRPIVDLELGREIRIRRERTRSEPDQEKIQRHPGRCGMRQEGLVKRTAPDSADRAQLDRHRQRPPNRTRQHHRSTAQPTPLTPHRTAPASTTTARLNQHRQRPSKDTRRRHRSTATNNPAPQPIRTRQCQPQQQIQPSPPPHHRPSPPQAGGGRRRPRISGACAFHPQPCPPSRRRAAPRRVRGPSRSSPCRPACGPAPPRGPGRRPRARRSG